MNSRGKMQPNRPEFEHSMLRMGSVAFLAVCVIITIVSPLFHATSEDLTDHPVVFGHMPKVIHELLPTSVNLLV